MTKSKAKIGLVLTGGGARAAYQVGVVEALSRLPVEIVAVSAVGAGALNGVLVAASETAADAAERMRVTWRETCLSQQSAIGLGPIPVMRLGVYLSMLFASGVAPQIEEQLRGATQTARGFRQNGRLSSGGGDVVDLMMMAAEELVRVTTDAELDTFLSARFRQAAAQPRVPFFVSLYEAEAGPLAKLRMGLEMAGLMQAGAPRYVEVSDPDLAEEDRINAVLASATLPFLCEPGAFRQAAFIDGSFGGMRRSPGAVPLQPLRRNDVVSLDAIVVVHTESGVTWDASDFRGTPIIEIRPSRLAEAEDVGYFWGDQSALERWMAVGETDTTEVLGRWLATTEAWSHGSASHAALREAAQELDE